MAAESSPENNAPTVADPEEYNQTERLRAINQGRQRVENTIEQSMARLVTDDGFGIEDRRQVVRASLYSYLTNLEWLMVEANEADLLREQELGQVVIDPPIDLVELVSDDQRGYPRVIGSDSLDPFEKGIRGIQGYLTAPEVFDATWSLQIERRHSEPQLVSKTKQTHMPVHISMNAFRVANRFLNRAGVDVDLKEEQHRAVVDDEVLEEVEKWRKQNIK